MADAEGSADPQISFKVKTSGDGLHNITIAESATVLDLKAKLATEEYENIPVERQRLIYSGRVMKNDDTLGSYKIKAGNTLHLVKSAASNHPRPGAGAAASSGAAGAGSSAPPPAVPTNMAAGTPANDLLAGLTGARFAGHANLPSQDLFGPDGGMNLPSEDQITEMLSNPAVSASMNEALNNPAFVDYLINSNPTLRNVPNARELIQSPMFRSMMTDPSTMRAMNRMRDLMGGGPRSGANAFPAPGATDNTPADAASSPSGGAAGAGAGTGAGTGGAPANPFANFNPFLYGVPAPTGMGGAGGDAAANPFAALLAGMQGQGAGAGAGAGTGAAAAGAGTGAAGANTAAGEGTRAAGGDAGAGANPAANPFGAMFGGMPQPTPEQMQQALQMLGNLGGGAGGAGAGGAFNPFAAFSAPPAQQDTRSPEEQYASQLRQLNEMGFYDFDQNVAALRRSGGSVEGALAHLLGN